MSSRLVQQRMTLSDLEWPFPHRALSINQSHGFCDRLNNSDDLDISSRYQHCIVSFNIESFDMYNKRYIQQTHIPKYHFGYLKLLQKPMEMTYGNIWK